MTKTNSTNPTLMTQLLFFTSSSCIGIIVDVGHPELSLHLTALEHNLGKVVTEIVHMSYARCRAPVGMWGKSNAGVTAYGFLNGDFLEKFLDYEHLLTETECSITNSDTSLTSIT
jgi:DNA damage-binding protein 1